MSESPSAPDPLSPTDTSSTGVSSVEDVISGLQAQGYLPDEGLATAVFLSLTLGRPLLLEGEPGVGKTEVARSLAAWTGGALIRLQCFEGLDSTQSLYEWDHARQLLHLRSTSGAETDIYDERFLLRRPLLRAIDHSESVAPVLLIDELDRADDEFEAFLLELLSEWSVSIPELGTLTASIPPVVVITSNRTRDLHDALKRRCLYHWVDHPDPTREAAIVRSRVPAVSEDMARHLALVAGRLREIDLLKPPGVAETIDWSHAMLALGFTDVSPDAVRRTLGAVLKHHDDLQRVDSLGVEAILADALVPDVPGDADGR